MSQEFADFVVEQSFEDVNAMTGEYQLVAPGEYVVDVTHLEQKAAKSSGNSMIVATFTVAEKEAQDSEESAKFAGQKLWCNYTLVPQSLGRLKQLMIACGANLQRFQASEILNSRIRVTVVHRNGGQYTDKDGNVKEGKDQANVTNERPLTDAAAQAASQPATQAPPVTRTNGAKPATSKPATTGTARRA